MEVLVDDERVIAPLRSQQARGEAYYGCLAEPGASAQPPLPKRFMADFDARECVLRSRGSALEHLRAQHPAPYVSASPRSEDSSELKRPSKKQRVQLAGLRSNAPEQQVASMPFTPAEDQLIVQMRAVNASWPEIASRFNRSTAALKKRWYDVLRPQTAPQQQQQQQQQQQ
jgi:hypothetical protein